MYTTVLKGNFVKCVVCSICNGQFMSDATYPDNSHVAPGIMLNKSWIVRNTGSVPWTPTTTKVCGNASSETLVPLGLVKTLQEFAAGKRAATLRVLVACLILKETSHNRALHDCGLTVNTTIYPKGYAQSKCVSYIVTMRAGDC